MTLTPRDKKTLLELWNERNDILLGTTFVASSKVADELEEMLDYDYTSAKIFVNPKDIVDLIKTLLGEGK